MTTLDFISLIDGLEYCLEDTECDDGWMHCDECPLISNEFMCLLHERLKQYHEWKNRYVKSEGEWKCIVDDNLRRRIQNLELEP